MSQRQERTALELAADEVAATRLAMQETADRMDSVRATYKAACAEYEARSDAYDAAVAQLLKVGGAIDHEPTRRMLG